MIKLYGIPNCDTVKKARKWLDAQGIDYQFHDFRQDGVDKKLLQGWLEKLGWETLLNRRSTSWRALDEKQKSIQSDNDALKLLLANPTLIKRPVLQQGKILLVGFNEKEWATQL